MERCSFKQAAVILVISVALCVGAEPSTCDDELYYDNGQRYGIGFLIDSNFFHAVRFDAGPGTVTLCRSYIEPMFGFPVNVVFEVRSDTGGQPGALLWTSNVITDSMEGWYSADCSVQVTGPFYVSARGPGLAALQYQLIDNDGRQAPTGSQWLWFNREWRPSPRSNDLMIRARFSSSTGVESDPEPIAGSNLQFAPNPVYNGLAKLHLNPDQTGPIQVTLLDIAGREFLRETHIIHTGNSVIPLDLRWLPGGTYLVRIGEPSSAMTLKLVLHH